MSSGSSCTSHYWLVFLGVAVTQRDPFINALNVFLFPLLERIHLHDGDLCDCLQVLYHMRKARKSISFLIFRLSDDSLDQRPRCVCVTTEPSVCVVIEGHSEDAAADGGRQYVQELLHHRRHVPAAPLLRLCRRRALWDCQIWREHQPVDNFFLLLIFILVTIFMQAEFQAHGINGSSSIRFSISSSQACQLLHRWQGHHRSLPDCHRGRLE